MCLSESVLTNILHSQPKQLAQPRVMALFTCEFGAVWCVWNLFQSSITVSGVTSSVKEQICVGLASRTVSCPELRRSAATRLSCCTRGFPSAYRPLLAWSSVIHSWVPRYLKLAARAQDRGTALGFNACCYIGDGCFSGSNLRSSWRSLYFLSNTLSALSLTHVYQYRCIYWTYSTCPSLHSALRHCR